MRRWSMVVAAGTIMAALVAGSGEARAQERATGHSRVGCFRGRPLPACKSFWIVEMQGHEPLVQTTRTIQYNHATPYQTDWTEFALEWNLGHMANVTPTLALGGVMTLGTGSDGPFTGLKARARGWVSPAVSVELESGLLRTTGGGGFYPARNGLTADVRLNVRDQGSFYVRWDGVDLPARVTDFMDEPGGFHQALSIGVGLGSKPALWATGAVAAGYLALLGLLIASGGID